MILQYFPWSEAELKRMQSVSAHGPSILDFQLGGDCPYNCEYCDSPKHDEPCLIDLQKVEDILSTGKIKWAYCCGLGEPTANGNINALKQILDMCEKYSVKLSMFTSMFNLDDDLFSYIERDVLYVLVKLDTFVPELMSIIYGISTREAQSMLSKYERLKKVAHVVDGTTNVGASIVPSQRNYAELPKIIDWCVENNIFPLIGPLEKAGKCAAIYDQLMLREDMLKAIKSYIDQTYGGNYQVPVCPAVLYGLHITNRNEAEYDEQTGLSCSWFRLKDPEMIPYGNITEDSYEDLAARLRKYRQSHFYFVQNAILTAEGQVFGGCGGDVITLYRKYVQSFPFESKL